jgi:hypothetical protein
MLLPYRCLSLGSRDEHMRVSATWCAFQQIYGTLRYLVLRYPFPQGHRNWAVRSSRSTGPCGTLCCAESADLTKTALQARSDWAALQSRTDHLHRSAYWITTRRVNTPSSPASCTK